MRSKDSFEAMSATPSEINIQVTRPPDTAKTTTSRRDAQKELIFCFSGIAPLESTMERVMTRKIIEATA